MTPPCEVQLQAGDVRSAPVLVRGAPATCGSEPEPRLRARWHCAEPDEDDAGDGVASLRVHGERIPAGAEVEVREAASDAPLGTARADERGRFRLRVPLTTPPTAVEALIAAGELEWTAGPVPVSVDCDGDEDGDEDDEGDDEDEDEDDVKAPKKDRRSDDE
jgi:hypothetical protein